MTLRIRIPYWTRGACASLNHEPLGQSLEPGQYLTIERLWSGHEKLTLRLPMHLHAAPLPDDPSLCAVMYGPLVLAGRLGTAGLTADTVRAGPTPPRKVPEYSSDPLAVAPIRAPSPDPSSWLEPISGRPLEFRTRGQGRPLVLVPLNQVFDERYAVYWKIMLISRERGDPTR